MEEKTALITGVLGQDGSYLRELLLEKGYRVLGLVGPNEMPKQYSKEVAGVEFIEGDLTNVEAFEEVLIEAKPDEVYNLAAISDLKTAHEKPELTMAVNFYGVQHLLNASLNANPRVRFFQALSSRILTPSAGLVNEESPLFPPQNAYDEAKRRAYEEIILPAREASAFVSSGFLFNHESPLRDERFVTRKIVKAAVSIAKGKEPSFLLGTVDAVRDWGFAGDFVDAMHRIVELDEPDDFVIASGKGHTVKEFANIAFDRMGIDLIWAGEGTETIAHDSAGRVYIRIDPQFYRPDDGAVWIGDYSKINTKTGWKPETSFEALVEMMLADELAKHEEA